MKILIQKRGHRIAQLKEGRYRIEYYFDGTGVWGKGNIYSSLAEAITILSRLEGESEEDIKKLCHDKEASN